MNCGVSIIGADFQGVSGVPVTFGNRLYSYVYMCIYVVGFTVTDTV